jgi:glycosyltransferase involved in cell wall biosynthesis
MHIGVSAWRLQGQRFGIGRYIEYLLKNWNAMLAPDDRVTVFTHEPLDTRSLGLSEAFCNRVIQPALTNALWENVLLPRAAGNVDVLFGPSYTLPLFGRRPSVVTIHSVDEVADVHALWPSLIYAQKYRLSARRADMVITNSHSVTKRVCEVYGIPEHKVATIWLGADEAFRPIDDESRLRAARIRHIGRDRPYILFAGGLSRRRNVPMLIEAFSILKKRDGIPHALLLFGANRGRVPFREIAERHGVSDSVIQTDGRVHEHRELVDVYNAASLYVLPSSSEGFSLTLAEALSCGTPVITVNCAALGEVAHGYALTIDSPNLHDLTEAMATVLKDPAVARALTAKGLERAKELRWDRTARKTLDVLREVASHRIIATDSVLH